MTKKQPKPKPNRDEAGVLRQLPPACADERLAVEFLEKMRWNGQPYCPHCGCVNARQMTARDGGRNARFLWRCGDCGKQFTVRVGTVFEDSRIPLRHWCYAFWAACSSKKGVSALQICRQTRVSYKSALFMMHRIRFAMTPEPGASRRLSGTVEVDETYVGGKPRKYPSSYRGPRRGKGFKGDKECVVAMIERGGELRPVHVDNKNEKSVGAVVVKHVARDARLMTDESHLYKKLGRRYASHDAVMHSLGEYARVTAGDVAHTNTAEGFFSLLKRGLYGTFHSVSPKHLHRYLSEFEFRFNTREMDDGQRAIEAIRRAAGKRLTYRAQVADNA
jgi:transposase-like protein